MTTDSALPVMFTAGDPEAEILGRLRAGDEAAFAELVDRWSPSMLRMARAYVSNPQSAQDDVKDAWLGVVHGLARFEGRSAVRTWVFTILVDRARCRGAREAGTMPRSQVVRDDAGGPTVDADRFQDATGEHPRHWTSTGSPQRWDTHPERRLLGSEALALLDRALETLPARQRLVVTLRDVQDLTSQETCAVLRITPHNQRVLLHRGRAALRRALEDYYRG